MTSDGQAFTTVVSFTTVINPGTVVSSTPKNLEHKSGTDVGPIVGGVVGGIAGLAVLIALLLFLLRRRRTKHEFDGNFDPGHVTSSGRAGGVEGGGTLPQIPLSDEDLDDGMGGRLNGGVGGGGIISPYAYTPGGGSMSQVQPLMAGAGVGAGAAAYQHQHAGQGQGYATSSGAGTSSYYPHSATSEGGHAGAGAGGVPQTPVSDVHTASSGSYYPNSVHPYAPPVGHGPSPGMSAAPSILSSSEHSSGGGGGGAALGYAAAGAAGVYNPRSAKELEAMGHRQQYANRPHVTNPDDPQASAANMQARHSAYLQHGPGGTGGVQTQQPLHHTNNMSLGSGAGSGYNPNANAVVLPDALRPGAGSPQQSGYDVHARSTSVSSGAGSAVVVHQDGGRVVMRKGEAVPEEEELREIPPTYDSLVQDRERREGGGGGA